MNEWVQWKLLSWNTYLILNYSKSLQKKRGGILDGSGLRENLIRGTQEMCQLEF